VILFRIILQEMGVSANNELLLRAMVLVWTLLMFMEETEALPKGRPSPGKIFNTQTLQEQRARFKASGNWLRPEFYGIFSVIIICFLLYFFRKCCRNFVDPDMIFRELELDDTPLERFDGIEATLFNRLRDPWNYAPLAAPAVAMSEEEIDAMQKRNNDMMEIRDAAEMLKVKNIQDSITRDIEAGGGAFSGGRLASVADQGSPTYAQKLERYDDEVYNDVYSSKREGRPVFKSEAQQAIEKERALMTGDAAPEAESDVFRQRRKKDDDYIGRYKVAGSQENNAKEGIALVEEKEKAMKGGAQKNGWNAWDSYQGKGGEDYDDGDDDSAYEIMPDNKVGLSARRAGAGANEHKDGTYHAAALQESQGSGITGPPPRPKEKAEDPRFASRKGGRKTGGYQEPKLGARPGTGSATNTNKTQFGGRAPPSVPPRTQDNNNAPSTANIKAAGGSFSQGSGPLPRQDTATTEQLGAAAALSVKISPDKSKNALQLDLSKVKTASGKVRVPSQSPDKATAGGANSGKANKPIPQQSLATMTNLVPARPLGEGNTNTGVRNNPSSGTKYKGGNAYDGPLSPVSIKSGSSGSRPGSGSGTRVSVNAAKVKTAPRGVPLPRPAGLSATGTAPTRPGSGGSDGRGAGSDSGHSSRSSGRSGISREEAKSLNANKALKLASFRGAGADDEDEGYDMGVVGAIDPLATRKGPSPENTGGLAGMPPSLMTSSAGPRSAAPPGSNLAVQRAVAAAANSLPGSPPARAPVLPGYKAGAMLGGGGPRALGLPRGGPIRGSLGQPGPPPRGVQPPPPRGMAPPSARGPVLGRPPMGRPPPSARAPARGPRPPPRGPLARPPSATE
jgi:hypothetical protein